MMEQETNLHPVPYAVRRRPIWYQVAYTLAAHRTHLALEPGSEPLIKAARPALLELAFTGAARLLEAAAATLDEFVKEPKPRRHWWRRGDSGSESDQLEIFLSTTMEPAAAILLAGISDEVLRLHSIQFEREEVLEQELLERSALRKLVQPLEAEGTGATTPSTAPLLVRYALGRPQLGYRVHYNAACYFSGPRFRDFDWALNSLTTALRCAPPDERAALAAWARKDPSLTSLQAGSKQAFDELLDVYAAPNLAPRRETATEESEKAGRHQVGR